MSKAWFVFSCGLIGAFWLGTWPATVLCGQAPMVEKHIFSPAADQKGTPLEDKKSPVVKQIEREIIFTGVIGSPQGRRAMLSEKVVRQGKRQPELYKEGDEIRGMTIKKIGSNFIVLAAKGKDVKLNLYQGTKMRPAPPALPAIAGTPVTSLGGQKASSSTVAGKKPVQPVQKSMTPGSARKPTGAQVDSGAKGQNPAPSAEKPAPKPSNPFLEALKRAARAGGASGGGAPSSATNSFLEAIRRAQQK